MKKFLAISLICLLLSIPLTAEDNNPPTLFRAAQFQLIALGWADFSLTSFALATGEFQEANPVARLYMNNPALSITINLAGEGFIFWGTTEIWKANKTLGWATVLIFIAARAYVLARNIKVIREHYR